MRLLPAGKHSGRGEQRPMTSRLRLLLEHPQDGPDAPPSSFPALARIIEAHSALSPLLDFCATDPAQIALAVGMVYPAEEDGQDDLSEIDFGQDDWFEPLAGLAAVERALAAVRRDPLSIAAALYDPGLRSEDVLADLEGVARALQMAQQQETRFHFLQTP